MRVTLLLIPIFWLSSSASMAQTIKRLSCPHAPIEQTYSKTVDDFSSVLSANNIFIKTPLSDPQMLEHFFFEFDKFPASLQSELVSNGAEIHLIEGDGVKSDPSWALDAAHEINDPTWGATFDGRGWDSVPGAGGSLYGDYKTATRIVVNHLYTNHGSINLVLHEHSHTLDYQYTKNAVSGSRAWFDMISKEANFTPFVAAICGDYCTKKNEEAFAETFAYYHACDEARTQMETTAPLLAKFFQDLTTVKGLMDNDGNFPPIPVPAPIPTPTPAPTPTPVPAVTVQPLPRPPVITIPTPSQPPVPHHISHQPPKRHVNHSVRRVIHGRKRPR